MWFVSRNTIKGVSKLGSNQAILDYVVENADIDIPVIVLYFSIACNDSIQNKNQFLNQSAR